MSVSVSGCKGNEFSSDLQIFRRFSSKIVDGRGSWGKSACGNAAKVANYGKGMDRNWAVCILGNFRG
jgi:hypothetical protein